MQYIFNISYMTEQRKKVEKQAIINIMEGEHSKKQSLDANPCQYNITLKEGEYFKSIEDDFKTIYGNFSLLSYLNPKLGVEILYRYQSVYWQNVYLDFFAIHKSNCRQILCLLQIKKEQHKEEQKEQKELKEQKEQKELKEGELKKIEYLLIKPHYQKGKSDKEIIQQISKNLIKNETQDLKNLKNKQIGKKADRMVDKQKTKVFMSALSSKLSSQQYSAFFGEIKKKFVQNLKNKSNDDLQKIIAYFIAQQQSKQKKSDDQKRTYRISVSFKYMKYKESQNDQELQKCIQIFIKSQIMLNKFYTIKHLFPFDQTKNQTVQFPLVFGQIEYFYQEPDNIRVQQDKQFMDDHYSIALQGGGVKGISYIGAYKSFTEHFRRQNIFQSSQNNTYQQFMNKINIKSVIGSSAGGILGLAICTGLDAQQIENICIQYLQNVPKEDKKYMFYKHQDQQMKKQQINHLKNFLIKTKIFDEDVLDLLQVFLSDPQIQSSLIQLLNGLPSIKQLLVTKQISTNQQKLCILGLLMGAMMKGAKIREISVEMLALYLKKQYKKKYGIHLDQMKYIRIQAQKLTMKQFYAYTNIEFTCTSVDLDDQILRFFNHKTTPDLPVCYAVQMTGSFPVGFQAQQWKKQWGKYYIHYKHSRRQKSLINKNDIGHSFTDGGVLANFPVKYLDNPRMRQKYFSHPVNQKTMIYGFGLNQFNQFAKQKVDLTEQKDRDYLEQEQQRERTVNKFVNNTIKSIFLDGYKTNTLSYAKAFVKFGRIVLDSFKDGYRRIRNLNKNNLNLKVEQGSPFKDLMSIKLINFGIKLMNTYMKSKDNLTKQCFSYTSIELVNQYDQYQRKRKQIKSNKQKVEKIKQDIQRPNVESNVEWQKIKTNSGFIQERAKIKIDVIKGEQSMVNALFKLFSEDENLGKQKQQQQYLKLLIVEQKLQIKNKIMQYVKQLKQEYRFRILMNLDQKVRSFCLNLQNKIHTKIQQKMKKLLKIDKIEKYEDKTDIENKKSELENNRKQIDQFIKKIPFKKIIKHYFLRDMPGIQEFFDYKQQDVVLEKYFEMIIRYIQLQKLKIAIGIRIPKSANSNPQENIDNNVYQVIKKLEKKINKNNVNQRLIMKNIEQIRYVIDPLIIEMYKKHKQGVQLYYQFCEFSNKITNQQENVLFYYCDLKKRSQYILHIAKDIKKILQQKKQELKPYIYQAYENQKTILEQLKVKCQNKQKSHKRQIVKLHPQIMKFEQKNKVKQQVYEKINSIDLYALQFRYEEAQQFYGTSQQLYTAKKSQSTEFIDCLKLCSLREMKTCNEKYKQIDKIKRKFESILLRFNNSYKPSGNVNKSQKQQIHLIFESSVMSEQYVYRVCQQINFQVQSLNISNDTTKYQISTITGSYYNALAMFLYASNLDTTQLQQKIHQIKNLVEYDQSASNYRNYEWTVSHAAQIKNIFVYFYEKQSIFQLKGQTKEDQINALNQQKQLLSSKIQYFLDMACECLSEIQYMGPEDPNQRAQQISRIFSCSQMNLKINEKEQQGTKKIFDWIFSKFQDIVLYIALSTPFVIDQLQYNVIKKNRKQIWKGILICQALKINKVKNFIEQTLSQLSLDQQITLSEFFNVCQKKIKLNFTIVDLNKQCIQFFNYKSTPQMPVKAALMACMSVPLFMKPYKGQSFWKYKSEQDLQKRNLFEYFEAKDKVRPKYCTGDILNKVPLQLLSNEKIKKAINGQDNYSNKDQRKQNSENNQIFFMINFSKQISMQQDTFDSFYFQNYKKELKVESIGKFDIIRGFLGIFYGLFKYRLGSKYLFSKASFSQTGALHQRLSIINMYVNSHDNLIKNTYKSQLVELPIRISTLQFQKIADNNKNTILSDQAKDVIQQAQYVMQEKLLNTSKSYYINCDKDINEIKKTLKDLIEIDRNLKNLGKLSNKSNKIDSIHNNYRYVQEGDVLLAEKYIFVKIQNYYPIYRINHPHKILPQNQYYIRFLSYNSNSKDIQQKHRIHIKDKGIQRQVTKQYQLVETDDMKIILKVQFPHIAYQINKQKKLKIKKMRIYSSAHQIQIPNIFKQSKDDKLHKSECYKIPYNYFIPHLKVLPEKSLQNNQNLKLIIQTKMKQDQRYKRSRFIHCSFCYSSSVNFTIQQPKESKCDKCDKYIKSKKHFECICKKSKYCFFCAYKIDKSKDTNSIYCKTKGIKDKHQIQYHLLNSNSDTSNVCACCGLVPVRIYVDKQCDLILCEKCKKTLLVKNHHR